MVIREAEKCNYFVVKVQKAAPQTISWFASFSCGYSTDDVLPVLRLHSFLCILAGTCAFVFAACRVQAIEYRDLELVRRENIVLLDLIVAHVAVFVHTAVPHDVEYSSADSERFVLQETLLHDNTKVPNSTLPKATE